MTAAPITTRPSDRLRIAALTATQLNALLDLADELKDGPIWWTAARHGTAVASGCHETRLCPVFARARPSDANRRATLSTRAKGTT